MRLSDISVPEEYKTSMDFRFFLRWFEVCLERLRYDTENISDLYDPLRCPSHLLWLLGDTMGYKYDDRVPPAFNRLVLLYFMSMIRNRGSKDGVTLAAEVNLAQFDVLEYGKENDALFDRLENPNIPVNAASVTPHVDDGYIEILYFSTRVPVDVCMEYVRPAGMYIFQHEGVRYDARTKISIDARLANSADLGTSIGPTRVGHYSREDYARMQRMRNEEDRAVAQDHQRQPVWYRNSRTQPQDTDIDPGRRALGQLQLCNNDHAVRSLLQPIFSLGYMPQKPGDTLSDEDSEHIGESAVINGVVVHDPQRYLVPQYDRNAPNWNLIYDKLLDESITKDILVVDPDRPQEPTHPQPMVNPIMGALGDAISLNQQNTKYMKRNPDGTVSEENV